MNFNQNTNGNSIWIFHETSKINGKLKKKKHSAKEDDKNIFNFKIAHFEFHLS